MQQLQLNHCCSPMALEKGEESLKRCNQLYEKYQKFYDQLCLLFYVTGVLDFFNFTYCEDICFLFVKGSNGWSTMSANTIGKKNVSSARKWVKAIRLHIGN